jgi:hypothetical protein
MTNGDLIAGQWLPKRQMGSMARLAMTSSLVPIPVCRVKHGPFPFSLVNFHMVSSFEVRQS